MKGRLKTLAAVALIAAFTLAGCKKEETKPDPEPTPVAPNYTNFKITSLKVTAMPLVDGSGASWDVSDGADVYFQITDINNNLLFDGSGSVFNDVTAMPLTWNFTSAYNITNLSVTRFFRLYDEDLGTDDSIGLVAINFGDYKSTYPTSITSTYNGVSITVSGSWY